MTSRTRTHYDRAGNGRATVTFSHSLGAHLGMWDAQAEALRPRWDVLRYDTRGHGQTEAPSPPYSLEDLADDVARLLDALNVERTHFVGLSLGGMIGQQFALRHPTRLRSLVLCDTTSVIPEAMRPLWQDRIDLTRREGMSPHVAPTLERWFTAGFRERRPEVVERIGAMLRSTSVDGYVGCCEAIRTLDLTARLKELRVPTLVIVGKDDPGTPPAVAEIIANAIEGAELRVLEDASHLSNVQQPEAFNRALEEFLSAQG